MHEPVINKTSQTHMHKYHLLKKKLKICQKKKTKDEYITSLTQVQSILPTKLLYNMNLIRILNILFTNFGVIKEKHICKLYS